MTAFLLSNYSSVSAVSDIDQSCSLIPTTPAYTFLSHEPGQIFVPTKNTLDAVSVRVKAEIGQTAQVKAEVIGDTGSTTQTIASKTQTITNTEAWVIFDFPDVAMPTGYYVLTLADADANSHAVWFHGLANCYERGYAVHDNQAYLDLDYRFAVNVYDAASATSGTGSTSSSQKGNSAAKNSNSKSQNYVNIIAQNNPVPSLNSNTNSSGESGSPLSMILFFLIRALPVLIFLFIILVLIIIGIIVVFKKSKKQPIQNNQQETQNKNKK